MANASSRVDYYREILKCIAEVQASLETRRVKLNRFQLEHLKLKLEETQHYLLTKEDRLVDIYDGDDSRRKALLYLHFAAVRAARLVQGCCCESEPWLQSAVTLAYVTEDIIDIVQDLRWWRSMVHIAIASVTWMPNGDSIEAELMKCAEEDFQKLLESFHNELENAASKDRSELIKELQKVETSYAGKTSTPEQEQQYLLAVHVMSRLKNIVVENVVGLNTYADGQHLGHGSFGAVMNVKWLGRRCALKVMTSVVRKEATCLSQFQHPYIVQFYHYWEASKSIVNFQDNPSTGPAKKSHILMELMDDDLYTYTHPSLETAEPVGINRRAESPPAMPIAENVGIDLMIQVTKAMCHMNGKGVVHRDLKPQNVLIKYVRGEEAPELSARGHLRAKLADFGLAKTTAMSSALPTLTAYVGTKIYAAPEIFLKDAISDRRFPRRADVWSFGIMLNEILSGKAPFPQLEKGLQMKELPARIKSGLRPALPDNCPTYLKTIIESCWQLRPQRRPSFQDLWRMLRVAQVRNLGIIKRDHNLFTYTPRNPPLGPHPLSPRCFLPTVSNSRKNLDLVLWLNRWFDYIGGNIFGKCTVWASSVSFLGVKRHI